MWALPARPLLPGEINNLAALHPAPCSSEAYDIVINNELSTYLNKAANSLMLTLL